MSGYPKHLISATIIRSGERRTWLAMCGESLGDYDLAVKLGNFPANYVRPEFAHRKSDCAACIAAVNGANGTPITIERLNAIGRALDSIEAL